MIEHQTEAVHIYVPEKIGIPNVTDEEEPPRLPCARSDELTCIPEVGHKIVSLGEGAVSGGDRAGRKCRALCATGSMV